MAPRRTQEFKSKVVEEAMRERNWSQVAKKYGVCESTVRAWIKASGRQAEAMLINPRSQRLASRRGAPLTTRVPTASRRRNPFHPVVEHGVLQFINRKRSEGGFTFTRKKIQEEALRISRENEIHDFKASIGWWNNFRSRNGISRELLNNGAPAENEDEPLEVDPPVEAENEDEPLQVDPPVEAENEDEPLQVDPPVEDLFVEEAENEDEDLEVDPPVEEVEDSQSEPSGQSAGERGGVPEVENFHEVALKSGDVLEGILNYEERYNPVWGPIASEEEEGILNQRSLDYGVENPSLSDQIDQVIALSPLALENISISELMETTLVDPLWPPLPSSSPPWCAGSLLVENSIF